MRGANPSRFRPHHNLISPCLILSRQFRYNTPNAVEMRKVKENIEMCDRNNNAKVVSPHLFHQKLRWIVLYALAMTIALSFAVQMVCCSLSASRRENIALRDHSDKLAHAVALANEFLRSNHTNVVEDYEEIKIIHIKDMKRFVFVLRENDVTEFKTKDGRSFQAHLGPYGVIVDYDKEQHSCFFLPQG